jgi:hypothetical protein
MPDSIVPKQDEDGISFTILIALLIAVGFPSACLIWGRLGNDDDIPRWVIAIVTTFTAISVGLFMTLGVVRRIGHMFSRSPVPTAESTTKVVLAILSDPREWDYVGGCWCHSSGLKLSFSEKNYVCAKGIFECRFNRCESDRILRAIDLMRSVKLTYQMGCGMEAKKGNDQGNQAPQGAGLMEACPDRERTNVAWASPHGRGDQAPGVERKVQEAQS